MIDNIGVVHGRFQILHKDHVKYIMAGKANCNKLIIGVTNPDPFLTKTDNSDSNRCKPSSNPCNFYERYMMIERAMVDFGLSHNEFMIVPLPINFPERIKYYVPFDAKFYLTINNEWGEKKLKILKELGLNVEVLWVKKGKEKGISSTDIRAKVGKNQEWEYLVPESTVEVVKKFKIDKRIREGIKEGSESN